MKRIISVLAVVLVVTTLGVVLAARLLHAQPADPVAVEEERATDLTVSIRHLDGTTITYKNELTNLDIVVDPSGHIQYLHCVLISGEEKDTHVWYNFKNVAAFKYRFHTITGKSKVGLKQIKALETKAKPGIPQKIELLDVDDYR